MLSAVLILIITVFIIFFIPKYSTVPEDDEEEEIRKTPQMKKLWSLAQSAMKERKPLKAEKALLTILKFDEKNAAAYNRLGILYAKEKHYKEAIECFEIAQSLDNNASSLHNVGLIYFETGKYEKAAMAFSQAIDLEGDQPGRYIAYAKPSKSSASATKPSTPSKPPTVSTRARSFYATSSRFTKTSKTTKTLKLPVAVSKNFRPRKPRWKKKTPKPASLSLPARPRKRKLPPRPLKPPRKLNVKPPRPPKKPSAPTPKLKNTIRKLHSPPLPLTQSKKLPKSAKSSKIITLHAAIAQLVEQPPCKRQVISSSLICGSMSE